MFKRTHSQLLCSMHQTMMKVLVLVCLAIAVLEVTPVLCSGQGPRAAYAAAAGMTGRRKRNVENDNPPPPPHDHSKEVSITIKNGHGIVSEQAPNASDSAGLAHKGMKINNTKTNSNSLILDSEFKLGGKLDAHLGTAHGDQFQSSGQGEHGLAGGFNFSVNNAAELDHRLGPNAGKKVLASTDNWYKAHGSSAGMGENKAGVHSVRAKTRGMGSSLAKNVVSGAAGGARLAASEMFNIGEKQIHVTTQASHANAGVANKKADGVEGYVTDGGIHATNGLQNARSYVAASVKNVTGTVTGGVHKQTDHEGVIETVHDGKNKPKNNAKIQAKLDFKMKTK